MAAPAFTRIRASAAEWPLSLVKRYRYSTLLNSSVTRGGGDNVLMCTGPIAKLATRTAMLRKQSNELILHRKARDI